MLNNIVLSGEAGAHTHNIVVAHTSFYLLLWLHPSQQHFSQGQYVIITAECMPATNMMLQHLKAEEFHMIITALVLMKHLCNAT